jgi:hypothetical protein
MNLLDFLESRPVTKFEDFHSKNPHVYESLRQLALDLVDAGHSHFGIAMIYETLRWQHAMRTTDKDFKLNNSYRAAYARMLMDREPKLAGVFDLRSTHD